VFYLALNRAQSVGNPNAMHALYSGIHALPDALLFFIFIFQQLRTAIE
jgi:hypothetical protein